jgi:hypothetical protein
MPNLAVPVHGLLKRALDVWLLLITIEVIHGILRTSFLVLGLLWLVLTVAFEFGVGHFVFGRSWESLGEDYNRVASVWTGGACSAATDWGTVAWFQGTPWRLGKEWDHGETDKTQNECFSLVEVARYGGEG